jgi:hypothetical protein
MFHASAWMRVEGMILPEQQQSPVGGQESALMKRLRHKAVEQETRSSP